MAVADEKLRAVAVDPVPVCSIVMPVTSALSPLKVTPEPSDAEHVILRVGISAVSLIPLAIVRGVVPRLISAVMRIVSPVAADAVIAALSSASVATDRTVPEYVGIERATGVRSTVVFWYRL